MRSSCTLCAGLLSSNMRTQANHVVFALCLKVLAKCIYRVTLHPYARYPGPFLAKFTNAYAAYHSWKGDLHIDIWRCHENYGDRVRYSPNRLLINTPTALRDIYSNGEKNVTKSRAYEAMMHRVPNTITLRDRKEHARRRRILGAGFSDQAIKSYEGKIRIITGRLCAALSPDADQEKQGGWSESRNMADWCNYVFFDLANDLIFGQDWNCIENPKNRDVVTAIQDSNVRAGVLSNAAEIKFRRMDKTLFPKAIIARGKFIKFIKETVFKKMTEKERKEDIFSTLVHLKDADTGTKLSPEELGAETANLISAGSDTSSTTLAGLFFYLSRYPAAYEKAAKEVRSVFNSPEDVSIGPALNSCTYLRACLDETLRMSPAVASAPWREVTTAGTVIDGCVIPPGYDVGLGIYSIQHNRAYVPEPFTFIPERWIVDPTSGSTKDSVEKARSAFTPFSVGPRSCIGKALAIAEVMFLMATILVAFDFQKPEGPESSIGEGSVDAPYGRHRKREFQLIDHVVCAKRGPMIQFRKRV
ncbi:cytochrome protein [Xylogone sp. PMI_703]|nr:cytochrome protein [Xylogone sp. PMI_703]